MPEYHEFTLDEIEAALHVRMDWLARIGDSEQSGWWAEWKEAYQTFAQIKQAQALVSIAVTLDAIRANTSESPELANVSERLSRIGSILLDK